VNPWRLALSRRWLGILGTTVLFAIACVGLGQWQFARRAEAQAAIALLNANYERPVVDLDVEVPSVTDASPGDKWRTVRITGTYLMDSVTYVRTRSGPGGIGFEQLVGLVQSNGTVFIVDRGWVPANADNSAPATTPPLPAGTVVVTSHLIPGEQHINGRDAPAGQIATINLEALDTAIDGKVFRGWYGRLASESRSTQAGAPWERPVLDEGPHLSYALQWYVFALMGFIGYGWALRKEARGDIVPEPKVRRRASDEDIEDAAVDATRAR
jgi:cytochrome oxidase assembly protein ShyY1